MFGGEPDRRLARPHIDLGVPAKAAWARGLQGYVEYPPSYCGGTLYVNTVRGDTWAVEAATGKVRWRRRDAGKKPSSPAIAGRLVIVSSHDVQFVDSLVTRVIELAGDKYYDLGMRYEEYLVDEARLLRAGKAH